MEENTIFFCVSHVSISLYMCGEVVYWRAQIRGIVCQYLIQRYSLIKKKNYLIQRYSWIMGNWSFSVCAYFGYDVFCCLYQESVENKKFKCPLQLMCICGKRFLLSIPLVLMRLVLWIRLVNLITKWRGKSNLPFELTLLVFIVKLWAGWLHQTGVVKVLSYSHLVLHHLIAMTMDHVMRCYHLSYNTNEFLCLIWDIGISS